MKTAFYIILLALILCSCSTPSAPEYNEELANFLEEVSKGWNFFKEANYGLSAASFRKAIEINTKRDRVEAYIGLGWSLAMQDSLPKAINSFNTAMLRVPELAEDSLLIYAGLSLAYRDIVPPDFASVRDNALAALELNPDFIFEYNESINANDLKAVLAEAYFNLENYTEAAAIVDPNGSLDSNDPDYHEKLLTKINQLITLSREGD
ncbi:MAG TPA: hypothetical protein VM123_04455 [archaeon]|nr:hypothetical protein [archaeon]